MVGEDFEEGESRIRLRFRMVTLLLLRGGEAYDCGEVKGSRPCTLYLIKN